MQWGMGIAIAHEDAPASLLNTTSASLSPFPPFRTSVHPCYRLDHRCKQGLEKERVGADLKGMGLPAARHLLSLCCTQTHSVFLAVSRGFPPALETGRPIL